MKFSLDYFLNSVNSWKIPSILEYVNNSHSEFTQNIRTSESKIYDIFNEINKIQEENYKIWEFSQYTWEFYQNYLNYSLIWNDYNTFETKEYFQVNTNKYVYIYDKEIVINDQFYFIWIDKDFIQTLVNIKTWEELFKAKDRDFNIAIYQKNNDFYINENKLWTNYENNIYLIKDNKITLKNNIELLSEEQYIYNKFYVLRTNDNFFQIFSINK